ncbi:MAG: carboxypeptidase-like regulatory domain-containing protein [Pseudomonadota bacterium]|nr:carboxypeptidase-like regulatory domain-containing protein [Pseudomonadota bacterium]
MSDDTAGPPGQFQDEPERPLWRRLALNRFVLVPGAIALAIVLWNIHVALHDNGRVAGHVVDAAGQPVAEASVALWALQFTTYVEKRRVTTGPDGRFLFTDNDSHNIQLMAEKPGVGRSARVPVRLYFRAQDVELAQPLRLSAGS